MYARLQAKIKAIAFRRILSVRAMKRNILFWKWASLTDLDVADF